MDGDAVVICQIVQRQVRLPVHSGHDSAPQADQLGMIPTIALGARLQSARLALLDHHVVEKLHQNPEPRSGGVVRVSFFHNRDDALPDDVVSHRKVLNNQSQGRQAAAKATCECLNLAPISATGIALLDWQHGGRLIC